MIPDKPGYWWGRNVNSLWANQWRLYIVFTPLWVDPHRKDLQWKYIDGSGGAFFPPGSEWIEVKQPQD
jgi:hypothetical protein